MRSSARGLGLTVGRGVAVALAVAPVGLVACGDDKDVKATPLAITTSDAGSKRFKTEAPKSVKGGLVNLTFTNAGKGEHEAQLLRVDGAHTTKEVLKLVSANGDVIPGWAHLVGGVGGTHPGETASSTLNLAAGKYVMIDTGSGDGPPPSASGALAEFNVTAGDDGALPASTATITAATDEQAKPANSFEVSGLKVGKNRLRFESKGEEPHHAVVFPILPGKTLADVKTFLMQQGRPSGPPPADFERGVNTAVLEGNTQEVADVELRKPGKYAVVCFLTDRNGKGKPHFAEGMLKEVDVK